MQDLPGTGTASKQTSLNLKPKVKPKVPYVMPDWLKDYIEKRERCIELLQNGWTNEEIKQKLNL